MQQPVGQVNQLLVFILIFKSNVIHLNVIYFASLVITINAF